MTDDDVLDLDYINNMLNLSLPPITTAKAGWRLDHKAILNATCGLLNLKRAVRVRFTSGGTKEANGEAFTKQTFGGYRVKIDFEKTPATFYHGITLSQIRSFQDANRTLWHELRHAWQAEQVADKTGKGMDIFHRVYKNADGPHGEGYAKNRFELDAKHFAQKQADAKNYLLIPKAVKTVDEMIQEVTDIEEFIANHERLEDD